MYLTSGGAPEIFECNEIRKPACPGTGIFRETLEIQHITGGGCVPGWQAGLVFQVNRLTCTFTVQPFLEISPLGSPFDAARHGNQWPVTLWQQVLETLTATKRIALTLERPGNDSENPVRAFRLAGLLGNSDIQFISSPSSNIDGDAILEMREKFSGL